MHRLPPPPPHRTSLFDWKHLQLLVYCPLPLSHHRASLFSIASYYGLQVHCPLSSSPSRVSFPLRLQMYCPLSLPLHRASLFSIANTCPLSALLHISLFHCYLLWLQVYCRSLFLSVARLSFLLQTTPATCALPTLLLAIAHLASTLLATSACDVQMHTCLRICT